MKLTKKKVLVLSLAVCLIAVASLGTLAWFTASDEVVNNFYIANSEDDPDDIFSVDVWEDNTPNDDPNEPKLDGIEFENILPGDELFKEVHIENTGSYDQYIRATVTVSDAALWQKVFGQNMVALEDFVNYKYNGHAPIHTEVAYFDAANDSFVYQIYYDKAIAPDEEFIVFDTVTINEKLDRFQAAELEGQFTIEVVADAVQVANVGDNVYEAFKTVGLVKDVPVSSPTDLAAALASEEEAHLIISPAALTSDTLTVDGPIKNKTLDFAGQNAKVLFAATATAENVVITGIVDDKADNGIAVTTEAGFTGDVTVEYCTFSHGGTAQAAIKPVSGNITVNECTFEGEGTKAYAIYHSGLFTGSLTVTDSTFKNPGSWAIAINNTIDGSVLIDGCTFVDNDGSGGVFKTLLSLGTGVTGDFTFTNNTMLGIGGHDGNPAKILVSGSGTGPVVASGTKTVTGNTLDGADWTQA
ncbi:MAG: right-handed parallel beta-helix repeat-containing protein [Clostridia bacterium]|nr:right-handed parallel beta-helix repeat-containing protein [Clostridia bacterium]